MADAHEAFGNHVEKKTPDKLGSLHCFVFHDAFFSVPVGKGDHAVFARKCAVPGGCRGPLPVFAGFAGGRATITWGAGLPGVGPQ